MKRVLGLLAFAGWSVSAVAQANGKQIVDKLCGCFEVSFKYAETFSDNPDYQFHEREYIDGTAELALPIEVSDTKIVIQHLLVVNPRVIVKHWREVWTYENNVFWKYNGDRVWEKYELPKEQVKGTWTQAVWEVGEEPRYQGYSPFVNLDGKIVWQNTTDAPLPRREYSVRNDYNILKRTNRLSITDAGYWHEQDNQKVVRVNSKDEILAEEKGWNIYKKLDDKECAPAMAYWEKNKNFWGKVRTEWDAYIQANKIISIVDKLDGKVLHEKLFELEKAYAQKEIAEADINNKIKEQLKLYVNTNNSNVAAK